MFSSRGSITRFARAAYLQGFPFSLFSEYKCTRRAFKNTSNQGKIKESSRQQHQYFKRNILDQYMDQPNHSFCEGKYSILHSFCFAEFVSGFKLIHKPKEADRNYKYQPDSFQDSLIEGNHNFFQLFYNCEVDEFQ